MDAAREAGELDARRSLATEDPRVVVSVMMSFTGRIPSGRNPSCLKELIEFSTEMQWRVDVICRFEKKDKASGLTF